MTHIIYETHRLASVQFIVCSRYLSAILYNDLNTFDDLILLLKTKVFLDKSCDSESRRCVIGTSGGLLADPQLLNRMDEFPACSRHGYFLDSILCGPILFDFILFSLALFSFILLNSIFFKIFCNEINLDYCSLLKISRNLLQHIILSCYRQSRVSDLLYSLASTRNKAFLK